MRIFATGGAGYVGSHCVKHLCERGHEVVVYDDLSQGHRAAVHGDADFVQGALGDRESLTAALTRGRVDAVMHFAASVDVGASVRDPLAFYRNNVANSLVLLDAMKPAGVRSFVFSSSCATYGVPGRVPIDEATPQIPINPYGRTKLAVEWMLADSASAWGLGSCSLRYFNACGAAADGSIGEDHEPEIHLIPVTLQVALGQRSHLSVFGTDYDTPDGTCIRDYIHVEDLADAHERALDAIQPGVATGYNVGTGGGCSVREVIEAARRVTGREIRVESSPRRPGDPPRLVADSSRIQAAFGWRPARTKINDIIASAWTWHAAHPAGYDDRQGGASGR